jgi:hypothetical protein
MKQGKGERERKRKPARKAQKPDKDYLALVRRCPCISCDTDPCREAAHVRMCAPDKPMPGMGAKSDDQWALPLCHPCHMKQHAMGEKPFWEGLGLNPLAICVKLWCGRHSLQAMRAVVFAERERRK